MSGTSTSLKLGYIGKYFMAGLLLDYGSLTFDDGVDAQNNKYYKGGGVGSYLGFHFGSSFKIWTSYLNSSLEAVSDDSRRLFGQRVDFGLGYRIWEKVFLNYAYTTNVYTQLEDDETGKTTGLNSNTTVKYGAVSLSALFIF
jgi:hypothetical protein